MSACASALIFWRVDRSGRARMVCTRAGRGGVEKGGFLRTGLAVVARQALRSPAPWAMPATLVLGQERLRRHGALQMLLYQHVQLHQGQGIAAQVEETGVAIGHGRAQDGWKLSAASAPPLRCEQTAARGRGRRRCPCGHGLQRAVEVQAAGGLVLHLAAARLGQAERGDQGDTVGQDAVLPRHGQANGADYFIGLILALAELVAQLLHDHQALLAGDGDAKGRTAIGLQGRVTCR